MGGLPEAVGQIDAGRQKELAIPLQVHDQLTASLRSSVVGPSFSIRVSRAPVHFIAVALLQATLLEPAHAADAKTDECGIASIYSTLSEETTSGEDTKAKNLTAAHQSLPFGTQVQVDNLENGRSVVVRITDRGPFVSGRIIDLSQIAAHELGFDGLAQVCLKILSIPENRPTDQD